MRRLLVTMIVFPLVAVGCGGGGKHTASVWSIKRGMTAADVRKQLGQPWRVMHDINGPEPGGKGLCLLYGAKKPGTTTPVWVYFCMNKANRVSRIAYGYNV